MDLGVYLSGLPTHAGPMSCVFLAAFLQSITGFDLVMVAAPLLMFFYEPKLTIVIMFFLAACGNSTQLLLVWKQVHWQRILELGCGALVGIPLGLVVFRHLPGDGLKIVVSVVILFTLTVMEWKRKRFEETRRNTVLTGVLAGIMAMTTGMAGPPLVLYFAYKLFWFQAILHHVCKGQQEIRFENLIDHMIASAWYMVTEYHLNLGPRDKLEEAVNYISSVTAILPNVKQQEIRNWLQSSTDSAVTRYKRTLTLNVPFRLQAPFLDSFRGDTWNCGARELAGRINQ